MNNLEESKSNEIILPEAKNKILEKYPESAELLKSKANLNNPQINLMSCSTLIFWLEHAQKIIELAQYLDCFTHLWFKLNTASLQNILEDKSQIKIFLTTFKITGSKFFSIVPDNLIIILQYLNVILDWQYEHPGIDACFLQFSQEFLLETVNCPIQHIPFVFEHFMYIELFCKHTDSTLDDFLKIPKQIREYLLIKESIWENYVTQLPFDKLKGDFLSSKELSNIQYFNHPNLDSFKASSLSFKNLLSTNHLFIYDALQMPEEVEKLCRGLEINEIELSQIDPQKYLIFLDHVDIILYLVNSGAFSFSELKHYELSDLNEILEEPNFLRLAEKIFVKFDVEQLKRNSEFFSLILRHPKQFLKITDELSITLDELYGLELLKFKHVLLKSDELVSLCTSKVLANLKNPSPNIYPALFTVQKLFSLPLEIYKELVDNAQRLHELQTYDIVIPQWIDAGYSKDLIFQFLDNYLNLIRLSHPKLAIKPEQLASFCPEHRRIVLQYALELLQLVHETPRKIPELLAFTCQKLEVLCHYVDLEIDSHKKNLKLNYNELERMFRLARP